MGVEDAAIFPVLFADPEVEFPAGHDAQLLVVIMFVEVGACGPAGDPPEAELKVFTGDDPPSEAGPIRLGEGVLIEEMAELVRQVHDWPPGDFGRWCTFGTYNTAWFLPVVRMNILHWTDGLTIALDHGCANHYAESVSSLSSTDDPAAVARSYLQSFAAGDPSVIADHVTGDFQNEHTSALGSSCRGKDAYRDRLPGFLADMVDLRYEIEDLVVEGATVAAFYTMHAKWQGDAPISVRGVQRLVVRDGLIAHRIDYWDSQVFLQQVEAFTAED